MGLICFSAGGYRANCRAFIGTLSVVKMNADYDILDRWNRDYFVPWDLSDWFSFVRSFQWPCLFWARFGWIAQLQSQSSWTARMPEALIKRRKYWHSLLEKCSLLSISLTLLIWPVKRAVFPPPLTPDCLILYLFNRHLVPAILFVLSLSLCSCRFVALLTWKFTNEIKQRAMELNRNGAAPLDFSYNRLKGVA